MLEIVTVWLPIPVCSWPWWTDPPTPPFPMKLMKNLLQRALMDKVRRIRSPWMLADRKGSGRGQWTRSFSFIKIWLVHFQVFSILSQNNFRYLVSHILRFWGILVSWGQNSGYIGIPLPPPPSPGRAWIMMRRHLTSVRLFTVTYFSWDRLDIPRLTVTAIYFQMYRGGRRRGL